MNGWHCGLAYFEGNAWGEVYEWDRPKSRVEDFVPSVVYYCVRCGSIYARLEVHHHVTGRPMQFTSQAGCCPDCPSPYKSAVPGSAWSSWDHEFLDSLPVEVLNREFNLHYEHAQKKGLLQ